jgi:hypothetical protein
MANDWEEEGNPWTVRGVTRRFENPWFALEEYDTLNPAGGQSIYGVIRMRKIAVGVLPIEAVAVSAGALFVGNAGRRRRGR